MAGFVQRFGRIFGAGRAAASQGLVPSAATGGTGRDGAAAGAAGPGAGRTEAATEFAGKRALVADDSEINCTILRTFLERVGFEVTLAADGREALERWVPAGHDLLCLDIEMPVMDGLEAMVRMRAEVGRTGIAMPMALAVTKNALAQDVAVYLGAGFDACLSKPLSRGDLVDLLRRRWPPGVGVA